MIGKRLRKIIRQLLNIVHIKEKEICPGYISKLNSNCIKQMILLMILKKEKEGWHHLAVKKLPRLLKGIRSKSSWWFSLLELSSFF